MTLSETLKKRWYIIILITVFFFILAIYSIPIIKSPHPGVSLTKINESGIPRGTIIHLSNEDFEEFPMLAPVIRDNTKWGGVVYANGTRISYGVGLSWEEADKFNRKFLIPSMNRTTGEIETYFEYKGQYYSFTPPTHP